MRTIEDREQLVDLGDAVVETKGSLPGVPDIGAGTRPPFGGLTADD